MERRVEALEASIKETRDDMKALRADLHAMRSDLSYIKGRMESLPTSIQLLGFAIAVFVAAGVLQFFTN
jgi:hypothetical protein